MAREFGDYLKVGVTVGLLAAGTKLASDLINDNPPSRLPMSEYGSELDWAILNNLNNDLTTSTALNAIKYASELDGIVRNTQEE